MSTYKDSGVDIQAGDEASRIAYEAAKRTFKGREGMMGQPVLDDGGFAGMLDMGDFYLVQNDDGVGTKIMIAQDIENYDGLGYDLLCMVADDAICLGAEVISITNTLDVDKVDASKVEKLIKGLEKAAIEQKVVIPGGEIAELSSMSNGYIWNATAVGIVEKDKVINGKDIKEGDKLIGLYSPGFRSNGFSLVRKVLNDNFGEKYTEEKFNDTLLAKATLTPSVIFHDAILKLHGRYGEKPKVHIKGMAHITGGGVAGNLRRTLKTSGLGANIDNAFTPDPVVIKIQELGNIEDREAYETWNMGIGMIIISNDTDTIITSLKESNIEAQIIGEVTASKEIKILSKGASQNGETLTWE